MTVLPWHENDTEFRRQLTQGRRVEMRLALDLLDRGFGCRLGELRLRTTIHDRAQWADDTDVIVEGGHVLEAKGCQITFTSPFDWPFPSIILCAADRWAARRVKPCAFVIESATTLARIVVPTTNQEDWWEEELPDPLWGVQLKLMCPHTQARNFGSLIAHLRTPHGGLGMTIVADPDVTLHQGDATAVLRELPAASVDLCVTSPPFFGLRDYGTGAWEGGDENCDHARPDTKPIPRSEMPYAMSEGGLASWSTRNATVSSPFTQCRCGARRTDQQIGLEETPQAWAARLVAVFAEVRRVLKPHGTLWVECGDSYAGIPRVAYGDQAFNSVQEKGRRPKDPSLKSKDLIGAPYLLAFALRDSGWYWRGMYVWVKPNPMPESVSDRCTTAHSYVLHMAKGPRYYHDAEAIREPSIYPNDLGLLRGRSFSDDPGVAAHAPSIRTRQEMGIDSRIAGPVARNARSVWTIATEPNGLALCPDCGAYWERGAPSSHCGRPVVAHYAAFPRELVRRIILAGTSERGVCPECGKPWEREVGVEYELAGRSTERGERVYASGNRMLRHGQTLGWRPTCACVSIIDRGEDDPEIIPTPEPIPAVVLDPFAGSGTTMLVAREQGRHSIGIELRSDYCRMVERRLAQLSLLAEARP